MARMGLAVLLGLALLGLAHAAKDNGGLCSFPYCDCWSDFPTQCLKVSAPTDVNNTYSFTVYSECDEPLGHKCDQTLYKLEFNTYAYCRWSKVTATYTWQGVTQPVPFAAVFDNAQSTTPCTGLQVLKVTKLSIPYAYIKQSPLTFTLALDDVEFCVANPAGVANPTVPPYPTAATCTLLKAYADSMGSIMFSCMPVNITAAKTCVKVTGMGSLEANSVCASTAVANFAGMYAAIGYGSYSCNLEGKSSTTCGCTEESMTAACANFSPPPSPSPLPRPLPPLLLPSSPLPPLLPSPLPPPVDFPHSCMPGSPPPPVDFPHSCMPGNSAANSGVGEIATETAGYAFTLYITNITANSYEVNIRPNPTCEPSLSGRTDCCNTQFKKTEFVIGNECRNAIATVETPGPSIPKMPSYQSQFYPGTVPSSMLDNPEPLTAKIVNLFSDAGQTTMFRVTLKTFGPCTTLTQFFPYGYWWAAYGDTYKADSCCGQHNEGMI
ncbi:hypothetical protein FOA52_009707 [Chlamydomonas sp. UWO 241]|nr:hypothetical protein FOA52_009707 [Chlamydomonas sp. UWO 241]